MQIAAGSEVRRAIWKALLDAHLNIRYWETLARRYSRYELSAKILLAVTSSSAVAGWGFWQNVEPFWKGLSALSALVAIALPLVNFPKRIQRMSELSGNWRVLLSDYDNLWLDYHSQVRDRKVLLEELKELRRKEAEEDGQTADLPFSRRIRDACYSDVLRSRGLKPRNEQREEQDHG